MDNLEIAKALFGSKPVQPNGNQTTTVYGIATSDSVNGSVRVNLGGDTVSPDDDQTVEIETTFAVFEGDEVIVSLVGADGTGKAPCVIGVVGRGDQQQTEINAVQNYFWTDQYGAHVSTEERSVNGANVLLDSDSLDIRKGSSNSEADQTVYASFGKEVTIGSRWAGQTVGGGSQVYGTQCEASGSYSHATGWKTRASGSYSHTEGHQTTASGMFSHAEGELITAAGMYSHAEGCGPGGTQGDYSHAEGYRTFAGSDYQHVQGKGNVPDEHDKYCDIVGNGVDWNQSPSNAYNMDWNGNAEFQGEVYVGGCTPNGETPYPVVRYNTSSSQSEYYNGSSWAQVPGGGGVVPASITPKMDGTGAVGTSAKYAREDHVHPSDTTKYSINNYGQGTTDVSIRPLVAGARANRLAFLPADQIIIEKTTDGGTTWEDAGIADNTKRATFATRNGSIPIPLLNGAKSTLCGVRITITAMKYNVPGGTAETSKYNYWNSTYVNSQERYTNLREMWFWVNVNNDALRVQVSAATGADPNNWKSVFNTDFALKGWSGSDWVRLDGKTFGGGITQTGNYWNWRITFWSRMNDGASAFASTSQQYVNGIQGYGDSWWTASNSLMREDHLYSWDVNQNATFPAKVTATSFSGNATSATKATQDESGNNIKDSYAASMSLSGSSLSLNNKNGVALSTVSLPGGGGGGTSVSITIAVSDWSSKTCTKAVTGVTSSNNIIVSPDPASFLAYGSAQIRATAQGSGTVTFACETVPAGSIGVNVLILG